MREARFDELHEIARLDVDGATAAQK